VFLRPLQATPVRRVDRENPASWGVISHPAENSLYVPIVRMGMQL
jgi:hypothetical protein